jgi:phage tail-like protein
VDVNGTKYHLLYGCDDWSQCLLDGQPLKNLWGQGAHPALEWDGMSASLRLARELPLFRLLAGNSKLPLSTRRGAGCDHDGNWYWIDDSESGIRFLPAGEYSSFQFWTATDREKECVPRDAATFAAIHPPLPSSLVLRGLAITTKNFLVVGNPTEQGLLVFELHRGGLPLSLCWPHDVDFTPWDLAATPDGGLLVLDRDHLTYWVLDEHFRLRTDVVSEDAPFQVVDASSHKVPRNLHPRGYVLTNGPRNPVSIEPGLQGSVLILDADPSLGYSLIYEYKGATQIAAYSLQDAVTAMDPELGEGRATQFSVLGHDFAYVESNTNVLSSGGRVQESRCECSDITATSDTEHIIYVADSGGKQAFAFVMDRTEQKLIDQHDFLPMRRWDGKAIVACDGQVHYNFMDRWVPLRVFMECHYAGLAVLTTPTPALANLAVDTLPIPGEPFDSNIPGCVWHRLFLDAQIPQETEIRVRARAADDPALLQQTSWSPQPNPYLRSGGAELPYYDPWADMQPIPEHTGTWELLFQKIYGRYLQIELTIQGTGYRTPAIRALRAWYPRFSYLDHYLPAIYREDPVPASFLDRWLANFEGFYTNLEDKIEHVAELFDPRSAPADTLAWLADWFGLVLDPLWDEERRRFLIRHVDKFYRWRGTVPGVEVAVRLYVDNRVDESLFDFQCRGRSKVRIVEHFLMRGAGGLAYGAPTETGVRPLIPLTPEIVGANAHRFSVLLPQNLGDEQLAMVQRIVELEKPAHTEFELKRYWDLFRVGEARLGLDTQLGESSQFTALRLGSVYLPDTYLATPHPLDSADQMVLNGHRPGKLAAL